MQLPVDFVQEMRATLPHAEADRLLNALAETEPVTSIRLNVAKCAAYGIDGKDGGASAASGDAGAVPWCAEGRYLDMRPQFTFDPLLHAGCYYVQEASSMFLAQAVGQYVGRDPCVALDLCAAPGGKSTHLRSLLPEGSLLVSNETVRQRANILAENMAKWGHPDVIVTNNTAKDFCRLPSAFDLIVTDVPCSGEGMFRKDGQAVSEWSLDNVGMCSRRQRDIIADVWPALKIGGLMIYSTCTFNIHEDEENVRWIADELGAEALPVGVKSEWNITGNLIPGADFPVYRFLPGITRGEGFFMAVLRKKCGDEGMPLTTRKEVRKAKSKVAAVPPEMKKALTAVKSWITDSDTYEFVPMPNGTVAAFPTPYIYMLRAMQQQGFRMLFAGVSVATLKGKDVVPAHQFAMSLALDRSAFSSIEVSYRDAVSYLQGSALTLPVTAPRGYVLITYRGVPLGFVKNLGNRANNLYPQEWRIRSSFVPDLPPRVL